VNRLFEVRTAVSSSSPRFRLSSIGAMTNGSLSLNGYTLKVSGAVGQRCLISRVCLILWRAFKPSSYFSAMCYGIVEFRSMSFTF